MNKEYYNKYAEKLAKLSPEENAKRNAFLRKLALGEIQGPGTNYPEFDKPWLKFYDEDKTEFTIPDMTVYDYVLEKNYDNMNNIALEYYGRTYTYKEFFDKVEETTKSFMKMGVKEGDVISFCTVTTPETFFAFYALNRLGAIPNMIDPRVNKSNIKKFIKDSNSKMVFYLDVAAQKLNPIINELGIDKTCVLSISNSAPSPLKVLTSMPFKDAIDSIKLSIQSKKAEKLNHEPFDWNSFIESGKDYKGEVPELKNKLDKVSGVVYTSGTTGEPKGSKMTNRNYLAMVYQNWCANMGWEKNDIILGIMPPFIAYGLVCGFTLPLCNGMRIDIVPKFLKERFGAYLLEHKPNHIMGVPDYMDYLVTDKKLRNKDLSFIKTAIVGGDKMVVDSEKNVNNFFKKHGSKAKITKGYGMTEMSSNAIYTINDDCNDLGSVGVPLINNDFKLVNEQGDPVQLGEVGLAKLTGPTLIDGYFNNEEETKKTFELENGKRWVNTKDWILMDKEGKVYFYDRDKRIIIRSDGHNVWPSKIEKIIEEHPQVAKCCVTGVKENADTNGEIPTAFMVIPKEHLEDLQTIIDEVNAECLKELPERDIALQYDIMEDLPLTPMGKIDYRKLSSDGVEDMKNKKMILARKK